MVSVIQTGDRRTSVDVIFEHLYADIAGLRRRPGDKISELEIAAKFGVSRQPVRDAFSRLALLDLLLIRPQRATEVRRFSARAIAKSRFVRVALEIEAARLAAGSCAEADRIRLDENLRHQSAAVAARDHVAFGKLDYAFHRMICEIARADYAYEVIAAEKAKVDRLCILSLSKEARMPQLLGDHRRIADAILSGDADRAVAEVRLHLSRLTATIEAISQTNADYFDT